MNEKENSSIAKATVAFYFEVQWKKKHFIGSISIGKWYNILGAHLRETGRLHKEYAN